MTTFLGITDMLTQSKIKMDHVMSEDKNKINDNRSK